MDNYSTIARYLRLADSPPNIRTIPLPEDNLTLPLSSDTDSQDFQAPVNFDNGRRDSDASDETVGPATTSASRVSLLRHSSSPEPQDVDRRMLPDERALPTPGPDDQRPLLGTDQRPRFASDRIISYWFPKMMIDKQQAWHTRKLVMLYVWTALATITFAINLTLAIRLRSQPSQEHNYRTGTLFRGRCSDMRRNNTLIHLAINVASNLLHFGSTQCMHILAAPSRPDIDKLHKKHEWLDVGVSSWRNLKKASPLKQVLWVLLVISSLPLHFL